MDSPTSGVVEKLSEVLTCAICLDVVDEPKTLQCQHIFCLCCIKSLVEKSANINLNKQLSCPLCKAVTLLTHDGVEGLPSDFRASQVREILAEIEQKQLTSTNDKTLSASPRVCCHCKGDLDKGIGAPATILCIDCGRVFCSKCHSRHRQLSSRHIYSTVDPDDLPGLYCHEHCEFVKGFCLMCETALCEQCASSDLHRGHVIRDFVGSNPMRLNIGDKKVDALVALNKKQHELDGVLKELQDKRQQQQNHLILTKRHILRLKEEVIKRVEEHSNQLLAKVEKLAGEQNTSLEQTLSRLTDDKEKVVDRMAFCKTLTLPVPELRGLSLEHTDQSLQHIAPCLAETFSKIPEVGQYSFMPFTNSDILLGSVEFSKPSSEQSDGTVLYEESTKVDDSPLSAKSENSKDSKSNATRTTSDTSSTSNPRNDSSVQLLEPSTNSTKFVKSVQSAEVKDTRPGTTGGRWSRLDGDNEFLDRRRNTSVSSHWRDRNADQNTGRTSAISRHHSRQHLREDDLRGSQENISSSRGTRGPDGTSWRKDCQKRNETHYAVNTRTRNDEHRAKSRWDNLQ